MTKNLKSSIKEDTASYALRWHALALLCVAQFMVIMDTSIIGVALPAIKSDLGYSQNGLQWIFNAYVIFFGGFLLLGGKLSDIIGSRKTFVIGFSILTGASLLAGIAWSDTSLNVARALQGLGSALIAPAALTMLMTVFKNPAELGKAFGFWGAAAAAGGSAGVFLGGVITQWLSWNWVFLINIPVGVAVILLAPKYLPFSAAKKGTIDTLGAILATLALVIGVYAVQSIGTSSSVETAATAITSIVLSWIFISMQRRKSNPLLPLKIFRAHNLSAGNIVMALMAASWIPLWFYLNLYLQQTLHFSAFQSGLALLPMTIVIMVLMVGVTGKLVAKFGFKPLLVAGLSFLTVSLLLFARVPENGSFLVDVLPASILGAIGMSLAYIPGTMAAMSGAKPEQTGLASGLVNTSYQIGSALGLAAVVAVAASQMDSSLLNGNTAGGALVESFRWAFGAAALVSLAGTVLAMVKIKRAMPQ